MKSFDFPDESQPRDELTGPIRSAWNNGGRGGGLQTARDRLDAIRHIQSTIIFDTVMTSIGTERGIKIEVSEAFVERNAKPAEAIFVDKSVPFGFGATVQVALEDAARFNELLIARHKIPEGSIVIHIETVATAEALAASYPRHERKPPDNYKTDEAIAKWYVNDEAKWKTNLAKNSALDPRTGRIAAIAISSDTLQAGADKLHMGRHDREHPKAFQPSVGDWTNAVLVANNLEEEEKILAEVMQLMNGHNFVYTFNGAWLMRFLWLRVARHQITGTSFVNVPRQLSMLKKYTYAPHIDLSNSLAGWQLNNVATLAEWCAFFGVSVAGNVPDIEAVQNAFASGDTGPLTQRATAQLDATRGLTEAASTFFTFEPETDEQLDIRLARRGRR